MKEYLAIEKAVGEAYREVLGKYFPAMAKVVVSALMEDVDYWRLRQLRFWYRFKCN